MYNIVYKWLIQKTVIHFFASLENTRGVGMKQSLNDAIIKNAKPSDKTITLKDGGGLFLYVEPNGSKRWRFRYRFNDKPCLLSLGLYPNVTLKEARTERERLQELIKSGINPSVKRKAEKSTPDGYHPN